VRVLHSRGGSSHVDRANVNSFQVEVFWEPEAVGGAQADVLLGGSGADTEIGGTGEDTLAGGPGADGLSGGGGDDAVTGGEQADVVNGGDGNDTLAGGDQPDQVNGGAGADDIATGAGDDVINGGAGADDLDGQSGFNICNYDGLDTRTRCVYDQAPAQATDLILTDTADNPIDTIDVTSSSADVNFQVHVTDDTGITGVEFFAALTNTATVELPFPTQVSGGPRNGVFEVTGTVNRYAPAGDYAVSVRTLDRVGRDQTVELGVLHVSDSDADTQLPQMVALQSPLPDASYDVRTQDRQVVVSARFTDDKSGTKAAYFCFEGPQVGGWNPCADAELVSGTRLDGTWRANITVPQDTAGGTYSIHAYVGDRAHNDYGIHWVGPSYSAQVRATNFGHQLPTGMYDIPGERGDFTVVGSVDNHPPVLTSLSMTPSTIDTLGSEQVVHFTVTATDATGEGVTAVELQVDSPSGMATDAQLQRAYLTRTSGTATDGVWEGDVVFPQGTPPGAYPIWVMVVDKTHGSCYASSSDLNAGSGVQPMPGDPDPVVTVVSSE